MHRRYDRLHARFLQPDPADFSYDLPDPQSFNRYSYTRNDPVNFADPTGLFAVPEFESNISESITARDSAYDPLRDHPLFNHGGVPATQLLRSRT